MHQTLTTIKPNEDEDHNVEREQKKLESRSSAAIELDGLRSVQMVRSSSEDNFVDQEDSTTTTTKRPRSKLKMEETIATSQQRQQQQQAQVATQNQLHNSNNNGNCCAGCREPIRDKFIFSVIDLHWHQDCVQCVDCCLKLNERCYTYDGKLYCKLDYLRRFGPKCFACREPVGRSDLVQKIMGNRVYHLKCFTCNDCHKQLKTGEQLHLIDGKRLLCNRDYQMALNGGGQVATSKSQQQQSKGGSGSSSNGYNGDSQQQTYYTLMSNQQPQEHKQSTVITSKFDPIDSKHDATGSPQQQQQQQQPQHRLHSGGEDDDEPLDELEDELDEEFDGDDDELAEDELEALAGAGNGLGGRLRSPYNNDNDNNNDLENEENHSSSFVGSAVGQTPIDGQQLAIANNKLKRPKLAHNYQLTKQHQQQILSNGAKRKRRRKQRVAASASGGASGGRGSRGGGGANSVALGGKKLAGRNGESILNGMTQQLQQATGGSILASAGPNQLNPMQSTAAAAAAVGLTQLHPVAAAAKGGQQQQQQPIKSVSSSSSNSSTSSSLVSTLSPAGQQQGNSQLQPQHHHHYHHHGQQRHHHNQHHGQQQQQSQAGHKPTRVRTVLNETQLQILRECYSSNPRPDALLKDLLVERTKLSPRVIRVWFQNKRCKDKKKSILCKQIEQQGKDGRHLAGLTLLRGVPMVASSPIQFHDDHSTVSSTPGAQQQQRSHHAAGTVHSPASVMDIQTYQPHWDKLNDYVHQHQHQHLQQQQQQQQQGGQPAAELNPDSPHYQQLMGQIHGFNHSNLNELQSSIVDQQPADAQQQQQELQGSRPPFNPTAMPGSEQQQLRPIDHLGQLTSNQPPPPNSGSGQQQPLDPHLHQFQQH